MNTDPNPNHNNTTSKTLSKFRIVLGVSLVFVSFILVISFTSYLLNWKEEQSNLGQMLNREIKSSNLFGKLGDWLGYIFIYSSFGIASYVIAFLIFVFGTLILKKNYFKPWKTISHCLFFLIWIPIFSAAVTSKQGIWSGILGFQIGDYLDSIIGSLGLWLVLLTSALLYFILELNFNPKKLSGKVSNKMQNAFENIKTSENVEDLEDDVKESSVEKSTIKEDDLVAESKTEQAISVAEELTIKSIDLDNPISDSVPQEETTTPKEVKLSNQKEKDDFTFTIEKKEENEEVVLDEIEKKSQELVQKHGLYDHKLELEKFQMPTIDLLKDFGNEEITIDKNELEENKNKIVDLLKNFNVGIAQIKATIGPTVTLYEIVPEAGIRVAQIKKLQDDIALNLSALGIRIIAPMPGKGTIGIEVPRKNPVMVSMRSVIGSSKFQNTNMDLPVVFGKTISNEIFMADLAKMPHLLMAGATGQGKSVGINAILASLLYKKHPSELKFVMVDPKKVELSLYSKIERHYLAKLPDDGEAIITDNTKVINTLNSLCVEMDNRYDLLKNAFCKNIKEYNKKFSERKLNPENGHRYLPYIVLVVDEFADLIMTAGKEVEIPIARLAQLARAIGIHLIVATQRPSVNVITGMIKANFPARAAFRVISGVDSKTILDSPGAEQLIGKGDMLFFNGNDIIRLQCAFIDTPEVEKIAEFIGEQKGYSGAYLLPEYTSDEGSSSVGAFNPNEKDALFEEAARIVVGTQQGSTSMLQRQLKLGYNRAGRIMDQLEASGIVGSFNGAKAREVLISDLHSLEQYLESLK